MIKLIIIVLRIKQQANKTFCWHELKKVSKAQLMQITIYSYLSSRPLCGHTSLPEFKINETVHMYCMSQ